MPNVRPQVILITGAASGIGRALALECHRHQHLVYATDLRLDALADLAALGLRTARLDVTSAADVETLVQRLISDGVQLDVLINNAGFGAIAPVAEIPLNRLRAQFEVNVFGPVALCQALVPGMVARGSGRIVNIGSVSGIMTTPFAGAYCASKAAVHALSDALRMELKPFGIDVVTVQPGGIRSDFGAAAAKGVAGSMNSDSLYGPVQDAIVRRAESSQNGATTAEDFARLTLDTVLSNRPPPVVRVGHLSSLAPLARRYVPLPVLDRLLGLQYRLGRLKKIPVA